jgi:RNA recognition motif-containing protein
MSVRLYVGNLPEELNRQELEAVFADAGSPVSTKIITDRKTNKCRGFGFVTVKSEEQADEIIEKFNGFLFKETPLKVERAQPRNKDKGDEPADAPVESAAPTAGGGRRKNNNKSRRGGSSSPQTDSDSFQPDPRWAQELEKLKQLLATQTTNP